MTGLLFIIELALKMNNLTSYQWKKSIRSLMVFASLLSIMVLIAGCPQTKQKTINVKPTEQQPKKTAQPKEQQKLVGQPEPATQKTPPKSEPLIQPKEPNEPEPAQTKPQPTKAQRAADFHNKCAIVFKNFVNDRGRVNYQQLKRNRQLLRKVLKQFDELDTTEYTSWHKEDKIAFWINAYNLALLEIIVDNYPIESYRLLHVFPSWGPYSTRHIDKRISGINKQKFMVMDEEFTLADIKKRFFQDEFDEPRVFFSICPYATVSSPPLRSEPYTGQKLNNQLDEQVKRYLSGTYGLRIDQAENTVYISDLLQPTWFGNEFIRKYGTDKKFKDRKPALRAVLNFITNYIPKQDAAYLETGIYSVKFMAHNWNINDQ